MDNRETYDLLMASSANMEQEIGQIVDKICSYRDSKSTDEFNENDLMNLLAELNHIIHNYSAVNAKARQLGPKVGFDIMINLIKKRQR